MFFGQWVEMGVRGAGVGTGGLGVIVVAGRGVGGWEKEKADAFNQPSAILRLVQARSCCALNLLCLNTV